MARAQLIHLNGVPGIGKTTVARRVCAARPGTMLLDLDVLRTWVSGWEQADHDVRRDVRTTGLSLATAWLATGRDVIIPQLVARPGQVQRFLDAALRADADSHEIVLLCDRDEVVRRFRARPKHAALAAQAAEEVAKDGGDSMLLAYHDAMVRIVEETPGAKALAAPDGDVDATVAGVFAALAGVS